MTARPLLVMIVPALFSLASCSLFRSRALVPLPNGSGRQRLDSTQAATVFDYVRHYPNGTQLALCFVSDSGETYIGIERSNDSLLYCENRDSVFEIGSISKTFTGTMLAKQVYDGAVDLHEPIKNILPIPLHQSSMNGREITLLHLANHSSGIPFEPDKLKDDENYSFNSYSPYFHYTRDRLYDYLAHRLTVNSTPGEKRTYSNLGGGLLGHLLTLITGKSYEQLLEESICAPLGMTHTFVTLNPERVRMMVQGRDEHGMPLPIGLGDCGVLEGAGGIHSSAADLAKYLRVNLQDTTYFALAEKSTMTYGEHMSAGLGWATYHDRIGDHVGAFGATGGYTCGMIFEKKSRVGLIVLSNVSPFLKVKGCSIEDLCRALYGPLPLAVQQKNK